MAYHLSGKVVTSHLDISTRMLIYVIKVVQHLF